MPIVLFPKNGSAPWSHFMKLSTRLHSGAGQIFNRTNAFHIFQSLDFLSLQGITAASVFSRFHTMCNGANLAYEKKAFEEVSGFAGIDQIASGDDMLLMHKIYLQTRKSDVLPFAGYHCGNKTSRRY